LTLVRPTPPRKKKLTKKTEETPLEPTTTIPSTLSQPLVSAARLLELPLRRRSPRCRPNPVRPQLIPTAPPPCPGAASSISTVPPANSSGTSPGQFMATAGQPGSVHGNRRSARVSSWQPPVCPLLHAASSLSAVSLLLPVSPPDGDSSYSQTDAPEERRGPAGRKRAVAGGEKGGAAEEWRPGIHDPTE
jgi:hypothetical protein